MTDYSNTEFYAVKDENKDPDMFFLNEDDARQFSIGREIIKIKTNDKCFLFDFTHLNNPLKQYDNLKKASEILDGFYYKIKDSYNTEYLSNEYEYIIFVISKSSYSIK